MSNQNILQSGIVSPGHAAIWTTDGVVQDGGSPGNAAMTELAVVKNGGIAMAVDSGLGAGGSPYVEYSVGVTSAGTVTLGANSHNGAPAASLFININGVNYPFPGGSGSGNVVGPGSAVSGNFAAFNGTSGVLIEDSGVSAVAAVPSLASIAALRALSASPPSTNAKFVQSYYSTTTTGGGLFWYNAADTTSSDNGGTIIVDAGSNRWYKATPSSGQFSVRDFGAKGDGSTNDTTAITNAAAALSALIFPPGNYLMSGTNTISVAVQFLPGAKITGTTTLNLNGPLTAGLQQIFGSSVTVVPSVAVNEVGYPEWFGAVTNNNGVDNTSAINACIVAFPVTQFQDAEYWHNTTINITTNYRTVQGVPSYPYQGSVGTAEGTQIILNSATVSPQVLVGATGPTGGNTTKIDIRVRDCMFVRGTAPTASGSTDPKGMLIGGTLFPSIENVMVLDSCTDFYLNGNIQPNLYRTYAGRATAATNPGSDLFYGYFLNGSSGLSAAGGNASTYLTECKGGCGVSALTASGSVGIAFNSAGADTYLLRCELDTCTTGLQYVGSSGGSANRAGDADVFITDCIFDGFYSYGIYLTNVANYGAIHINGGYAAPGSGASPTACIGINSCGTSTGGNISINGFQGVGWPAATTAGIYAQTSYGIQAVGNMWNDCGGGTVLTSVANSRFMDSYNSPAATNTVGAVSMTTCTRVYVAPVVTGASGIWTAGINMNSTGNQYCEANCTAIDIAACASSHKLLSNGTNITTAGTFNTNCLASGVVN